MQFTGLGYSSEEAAQGAGQRLKDAVRAASAKHRVSIDVGNDVARGGASQYVKDKVAADGVLLLPDVHGLHTFEQTQDEVLTLRGSGTGQKVVQLDKILESARQFIASGKELSDRQQLAVDLFSQSRMESSLRSRHLTLVTALEVLSPRAPRTGRALQLVQNFQSQIKAAIVEAQTEGGSDEEIGGLHSLSGAAQDMTEESIGGAIRRRVEALGGTEAEGQANRSLAGKIYTARSQLGHTGRTSADLTQFLMALETWIVQAVLEPAAYDTEPDSPA
nr:HEPN domain-containing protein [Geodermatophilus normandii]